MRKRAYKTVLCTLLLITALYVVFVKDWKQNPPNTSKAFKPIEVVTEVKPDSVFNTKYVVRIKRIEVSEYEYYMHTNKKYDIGFVLRK